MTVFYVGLNPRWQMYKFLPRGLNVMYSAAGFWNDGRWRRKRFPRGSGLRFLDCGGFTMLNRCGTYPFTTVNFMNLVAFLRPDYYVPLDYPCEPGISRQLGLMTNEQRIEKTVENAVEMVHWEGHVGGRMLPVIQGYTLGEYKRCIDLHVQAGTMRDYMAVGSMCRRIEDSELHKLIVGISEYVGVSKLHFFGLKLSSALCDVQHLIYSQDSAVALDAYSADARRLRGGRRWPRGQREKEVAFLSFLARLDGLGLRWEG